VWTVQMVWSRRVGQRRGDSPTPQCGGPCARDRSRDAWAVGNQRQWACHPSLREIGVGRHRRGETGYVFRATWTTFPQAAL